MTDQKPLTEQQLTDIETRAAYLDEYATLTDVPLQADADQLTGEDVPALLTEVRRLRNVLEQIRHLHKDSPMGPCPLCIDADADARGDDPTIPYPCPTARLAGATDCDPPHVRAAAAAAVAEGAQR